MPNIAEVRRRVVLTKCNFVRANIHWVSYCARCKASQAKQANKFGLIYSLLQPLSPSPTWRMRAERETWKRGATYSGRGKTFSFTESWRARQNSFFLFYFAGSQTPPPPPPPPLLRTEVPRGARGRKSTSSGDKQSSDPQYIKCRRMLQRENTSGLRRKGEGYVHSIRSCCSITAEDGGDNAYLKYRTPMPFVSLQR